MVYVQFLYRGYCRLSSILFFLRFVGKTLALFLQTPPQLKEFDKNASPEIILKQSPTVAPSHSISRNNSEPEQLW